MAEDYTELADSLDWTMLYDGSGEISDLGESGAKAIRALLAERDALRAAIEPFALGRMEFESADDIYVYYRNVNGEGIIVPSVQISDFRRARAVLNPGAAGP